MRDFLKIELSLKSRIEVSQGFDQTENDIQWNISLHKHFDINLLTINDHVNIVELDYIEHRT